MKKENYEMPVVEMQQIMLEQVIASSPNPDEVRNPNTGNEDFEENEEQGSWG